MEPTHNPKNSPLTIPLAIIIAGALIAGAVFFTQGGGNRGVSADTGRVTGPDGIRALFGGGKEPSTSPENIATELNIRSINQATDRVLGNPNADIIVVEYSDLECPFCKVFHETMKRVMTEYGKEGKIAWVYRHFPLTTLHSKAVKEAEATECAAELGGNLTFWKYADRVFEVTLSNDRLDLAELPNIAEYVGLDRGAFERCLQSGRHASRVEADYNEAMRAGGTGTPFNVLLLKKPVSESAQEVFAPLYERYRDPRTGRPAIAYSTDGMRMSISGAMPFETLKTTFDTLIK